MFKDHIFDIITTFPRGQWAKASDMDVSGMDNNDNDICPEWFILCWWQPHIEETPEAFELMLPHMSVP